MSHRPLAHPRLHVLSKFLRNNSAQCIYFVMSVKGNVHIFPFLRPILPPKGHYKSFTLVLGPLLFYHFVAIIIMCCFWMSSLNFARTIPRARKVRFSIFFLLLNWMLKINLISIPCNSSVIGVVNI